MRHQVHRRVRDEDRRVVRGHLARVRRVRLERDVPARRRRARPPRCCTSGSSARTCRASRTRCRPRRSGELFVPPSGFSGAITFSISGNRVGSIAPTSPPAISRLDASPDADTPSYLAPPPSPHQLDHLVRAVGVGHVDLAAGVVLERRDPVVLLVALGRAVLGVAVPRDQVRADPRRRRSRRRRPVASPPPPGSAASSPHAAATSASAAQTTSHRLTFLMQPPLPGPARTPRSRRSVSTGRLLLRSHRRRTGFPRTCSASIELVARFCSITTSSPPSSSSTMYRVIAPRYTTSRTCPVAVQCEPSDLGVRRDEGDLLRPHGERLRRSP